MQHYSPERKEAALKKMQLPNNMSIAKLALDLGISEANLYYWRKQVKDKRHVVPSNGKNVEQWSPSNKFSVVLETATLNEADLALYCRKKGLFVEQITVWKIACLDANANETEHEKVSQAAAKKDKQQISALEKELHRKEKTLAETLALLVLRKKLMRSGGKPKTNDPRRRLHTGRRVN